MRRRLDPTAEAYASSGVSRVRVAYMQRVRIAAARSNATVEAVFDDALGLGIEALERTMDRGAAGTAATGGFGRARGVRAKL